MERRSQRPSAGATDPPLGATPADAKGGPLLSGALFRHLVQELERAAGHDRVWRAVGALSEEQRSECLDILAIRWVHATTSVALVREVARVTGRDTRELHDTIIERTTERVFSTIWRSIFHFVSAEAMMARVPLVFKRTYLGITVQAELTGPTSAIVRIGNWSNIDELSFHGISVSLRVALRVVARQAAQIGQRRTQDGAEYRVSWK
jgi:hypothetical protein